MIPANAIKAIKVEKQLSLNIPRTLSFHRFTMYAPINVPNRAPGTAQTPE